MSMSMSWIRRRRLWLSILLALLGFLLQLVHIVNSIQHVQQFLHDDETSNHNTPYNHQERDENSSVVVGTTPHHRHQSRRREEQQSFHATKSLRLSSKMPVLPLLLNQTNQTTTATPTIAGGVVQKPPPQQQKNETTRIHVQVSNGGRIRPLSAILDAIQKASSQSQLPQSSQTQSQSSIPKIDRIYYINMDHRSMRRSIMERWLSELSSKEQQSIPYQRVSGQKGQRDTCIPKKNNGTRCVGISGLAETYTHIIQTMNTTGLSLVVEDDFVITDMERLLASIQLVPPDWDLLRWDCWDKPLPFFERYPFSFQVNTVEKEQCEGVDRCWFCGGTHVALWRGGASLQKLKQIWERVPHDGVDCQLSQHSSIRTYCLQVGIGEFHTPLDEQSDIPKTGDTTTPSRGEKVLQRVQAEVEGMSPTTQ